MTAAANSTGREIEQEMLRNAVHRIGQLEAEVERARKVGMDALVERDRLRKVVAAVEAVLARWDQPLCYASDIRAALSAADAPQPEQFHTNPHCLARWSETVDGEYNPQCCRFPKSCSSLERGPQLEES